MLKLMKLISISLILSMFTGCFQKQKEYVYISHDLKKQEIYEIDTKLDLKGIFKTGETVDGKYIEFICFEKEQFKLLMNKYSDMDETIKNFQNQSILYNELVDKINKEKSNKGISNE